MLTLHLFRHGDTSQSADGVFCGDLDPPLHSSGERQAQVIAKLVLSLTPTATFVSPKLRAKTTAEPSLAATGLAPVVEDGLREIGYGRWEGRKEQEIRVSEPDEYARWIEDPALTSPPGGESAFAIAARALPVLVKIRESYDGNVVIFSHKATIRVMTCALLGVPLGRFRDRVACPTASRTSFEFGSRGAMLVRLGDTSHLR